MPGTVSIMTGPAATSLGVTPAPPALAPAHARRLLADMLLLRRFEERAAECYTQGRIRGFLHLGIGQMGGYALDIRAFGLLGVEFDEPCGIVDLAQGFRQRLALFGHHDQRQILAVLADEVEPAAQKGAAGLGQGGRPIGKGGLCCVNGTAGLGGGQTGNLGHDGPGGRVGDRETLRRGGPARDVALTLQKARVGKAVRQRRVGGGKGGARHGGHGKTSCCCHKATPVAGEDSHDESRFRRRIILFRVRFRMIRPRGWKRVAGRISRPWSRYG